VVSELYVEPIYDNPESTHNATITDVKFKLQYGSNNLFVLSYSDFDINDNPENINFSNDEMVVSVND